MNGDIYCGEWKNDLFHGNGLYLYGVGERYIGEFINGINAFIIYISFLLLLVKLINIPLVLNLFSNIIFAYKMFSNIYYMFKRQKTWLRNI